MASKKDYVSRYRQTEKDAEALKKALREWNRNVTKKSTPRVGGMGSRAAQSKPSDDMLARLHEFMKRLEKIKEETTEAAAAAASKPKEPSDMDRAVEARKDKADWNF